MDLEDRGRLWNGAVQVWRCLVATLLFVVAPLGATAQQLSDKFHEENPQGLFDDILGVADTTLHYRLNSSLPLFDRTAQFGFYHVGYSRRGEVRTSEVVRLGAHNLQSPLDAWGDYTLLALLRRVPMSGGNELYTSEAIHGADLRSEWYDPSPARLRSEGNLKLQYAERNYRLGVHYSSVGSLCAANSSSTDNSTIDKYSDKATATDSTSTESNCGWRYSFAAGARGGGDAFVEGVYRNDAYLWLAVEKSATAGGLFGPMDVRTLMAVAVAPVERSVRSWNTEEVFGLAADRLYNSSWGYQQGRRRSAKIRREVVPLLYLSHSLEDKLGIAGANLSALVRAGRKGSVGLDWNEADSPLPDWYGYLPSGYADPELADLAAEVWRRGESAYTQVGWDRLWNINRRSPRGAVYAMVDEVVDLFSAEINLSGGYGGRRTQGGRTWSADGLFGGLTAGYHTQHLHNQFADLLGGEYPSEGFRLYDYRVEHFGGQLYGSWQTTGEGGSVAVSGALGNHTFAYANALTGRRVALRNLSSVALKAAWNYRFGVEGDLAAALHYDLRSPHHSALLAAPEQAATINPYARSEHNLSASVRGEWRRGKVKGAVSLWGALVMGESRVEHFWNDLDDRWSALMAGGINTLRYGVEAEAGWYINSEWRVEGVCAIGRWGYLRGGVADIVDGSTSEVLTSHTALHLDGLWSSDSPSFVALLKATHRLPKGWMVALEGSLAAGRYMEPSLFFCSDYLLCRNLTPEELTALLEQESLGVAPNLSAVVYRRVGRVGLSLSVRNLLGGSYKYGGYRPVRLSVAENDYSLHYTPHPNKYQYSLPRHIYLTLNYDF